ncbi:class I SAM-dependent methyltransferase [Fundidesulfovibrio soli]|uniref:class I SAM-dependent methyltransferase n=1 Tax=Fundidesulfovibrio soli TaxID=2922716 RepID=UPI001FB02647|nr:class I SAM-dependent methyltransferase [Fundidesulfovibrio soli]
MEPSACNLCGGRAQQFMARLHGRDLLRCGQCGLRWYHPTPTKAELKDLYAAQEYVAAEYFTLEDDLQTNHYQHMLQAADTAARRFPGGKVLEIGPGAGHFLQFCSSRGLQVEAIEFSQPLAQSIREKFGCVVREDPLEECGLPDGSFQVVAAFDLLEHVQDPAALLREIWRVLAPGGLLFLSTVSTDNLLDRVGALLHRLGLSAPLAKLHPPYHLYYFNKPTIKRSIEQADFAIEALVQENYDSRKATSSLPARLFLEAVYALHDMSGDKTNFYATCRKQTRD